MKNKVQRIEDHLNETTFQLLNDYLKSKSFDTSKFQLRSLDLRFVYSGAIRISASLVELEKTQPYLNLDEGSTRIEVDFTMTEKLSIKEK